MRRAIYPGSFDPITAGHLDVIHRAARLFDELIVAVAFNDQKKTMFTAEERVALIRETTKDVGNIRVASFGGLLVGLDELVVLSHRLPNTRVRQANYEALLSIINDCYQGGAANLGFVLAGTDECLEDKRRGLHSYEALRSRLVENSFAGEGVRDLSGPVVRLQNLTPEDLFVLLRNIRHVHASGDAAKYLVPDDALMAVLQRANETLGAEYFKTPRDVVRSFVGLLNVMEQNPGKTWPEFAALTPVPNPGSKATLYPLGSDTVAMLHNPNSKHRSPLALWISFDGMKTWPYQRVLVSESSDGPKGRLNYPDGFVNKDGQWLHFAYDDNRHRAGVYSAKLPPMR